MPRRGQVLVVEDDVLTCETLRCAVEDAGFDAILARDDRAAIFALEADRARDLVGLITDINLGGRRSGWVVAQLARAQRPDLPVVYVTGDSGHHWSAQGVAGSLLLHKPFTPTHVIDALIVLIERSRIDL